MSTDQHQKHAPAELDDDPTASSRKRDHIELALRSQVGVAELDQRFYYEPMMAAHPQAHSRPPFPFLSKTLRVPLWVSSMTGGTEMARTINHNLARACGEFGMGMGLGSCRSLIYSDETLPDFAVRPLMGPGLPLFANLGIAQLEQLIARREVHLIRRLVEKLDADGLIIHVNPMQEWLQPEGDRFLLPPLQTIETLIEALPDMPLIVKEVGQGMGYESLKHLFQLPLQAIDFAANGGTNFAKLELLRTDAATQEVFLALANVGHSAEDMVGIANALFDELGDQVRCREVIISGGVKNFLDGYYLIHKIRTPAIYGQASGFLLHARGEYEALRTYVQAQLDGLDVAGAYLKVR